MFTLGGIIVDLVIVLMILLSTYLGYRKGLVGVIFKLLTFVLSIVIMFLIYKPVSNAIINNTQIDEKIATVIQNSLSNTSIANNEPLSESSTNLSEGVVNFINSLVSEALNKAESDTLSYVSTELSHLVVRLGSMILVFIIANVLLFLFKFIAELLSSLPVLNTFNSSGGLLYGLLKGLLIIYILLAVISVISPLISSWGVLKALNESFVGSRMYNNNIIINLISK